VLNYNTIYLKKEEGDYNVLGFEDPSRPSETFGANIIHLLSNSFFVEDGLVGEFAIKKIDETIAWLNDSEDSSNKDYHRKLIANIDEPLIRIKLEQMFKDKFS
jgi:hypothetical protein